MDIGKEDEEAIEVPMPVNPRKVRREIPVTPAVPATPVPARQSDAELDQAVVDACQSVARQLRALHE